MTNPTPTPEQRARWIMLANLCGIATMPGVAQYQGALLVLCGAVAQEAVAAERERVFKWLDGLEQGTSVGWIADQIRKGQTP